MIKSKISVLLVLLSYFVPDIFSQKQLENTNYKIQLGKEKKENIILDSVFFSEEGKLFLINEYIPPRVNFGSGKRFLEVIDQNLETRDTFLFDPKVEKAFYFNKLIVTKNNCFLMFIKNIYKNDEDRLEYYYKKFDPKSFSVETTFNKFHEIDGYPLIETAMSPDKSKLLFFSYHQVKRKENMKFSVWVFDQNLSLDWEKTYEISFPPSKFILTKKMIDNDGDVFFIGLEGNLAGYALDSRADSKGDKYHLVSCMKKDSIIKLNEINTDKKNVTDIHMSLGSEGHILIGGLYADEGFSDADGAFFVSLDKLTNSKQFEKIHAFENKITDKKITSFLIPGISDYDYVKVKEFLVHKDGGFYLIAERIAKKTKSSGGGTYYSNGPGGAGVNKQTTGGGSAELYYYNQILIAKIKENGELGWVSIIQKKQEVAASHNIPLASFLTFTANNKLYCLYNEDPKNLLDPESKKSLKIDKYPATSVILAEIDENGIVKKEVLFTTKKGTLMFCPLKSKVINSNELFLYFMKRETYNNKFQYCRLTI